MKSFKYEFLPPDSEKPFFDKLSKRLLCHLYPGLVNIWHSGSGWSQRIIKARRYSFCQFATRSLMFLYRKWLKISAAHGMANDPELHDGGIQQANSPMGYTMRFNCPPASCRWRLHSRMPEGGVRKCNARYCPHCHFRRVVNKVRLAVKAAATVRKYYDNLYAFVYEVRLDEAESPVAITEAVATIIAAVRYKREFLGAVTYFKPFFYRDNSVGWRLRMFLLGDSKFHLDRSNLLVNVELLKAVPATTGNVCNQVAKAFSWGQRPFWHDRSVVALWNQLVGDKQSTASYGCMISTNKTIFDKFRKNHDSKKMKLFHSRW